MAKIEILSFKCIDETGGGLEVGKDEVAFCVAVFGVDAGAYSEYRRFETRLATGLDDDDRATFPRRMRFRARAREDGRPSWPLQHLEFHVAAYELEGSEDTATAARRVYERWQVKLAERYQPGLRTDVERGNIDGDVGSARNGMSDAIAIKGEHEVVMLDAWRLDLNDPRGNTFSAPGVGQSNGLYVAPVQHGIHRSPSGIQRWRNNERTSELRTYGSAAAKSAYSFYVDYYDD